ncbi:hypothetical protein BH11GEM2_BH11GEM2_41200 [soil metagenome]
MLMPMKAPTHVRRFVLLSAAIILSACSADVSTAPTSQVSAKSTPSMFVPTAAAKALIGVVDGTYTYTVDPTRDQSLNLGPNHLDIPAYGICDLRFSGYGPTYWDRSCQPQYQPLVLTVVIKNASSSNPSIDFYPAMRFNPYKTVQLFMYAPNVSVNDAKNWQMLYCPDFGGCFNESLNDASLQTKIDYTNNVLFRRVKHFSGYTVAE